ncbi:hypothetical protein APU11_17930 [Enterobacter sp. 50793107]|nr:hypothetical protein APU11_17930 [Enterobacter sp. 50793107]KTH24935.1 hypothetical protein ASV29_12750 [Enterobacter cloacae subsp. cloacae]PDQ14399.1 hypothetical protein CKK21_14900 [Enterobacter cloacae]KTH28846.1 hypothetical protein ASV28_11540 [Enterobacter cloacae subsp. cloacae]RLS12845.1 hypothetical protein CKO00_22970 [Enterobacter cloacae]
MVFSEIAVLSCQIVASLLMGCDYFMPSTWRGKINQSLSEYFSRLRDNVDRDISMRFKEIFAQLQIIFFCLSLLAIAVAIYYFRVFLFENLTPMLYLCITIISILCAAIALHYIIGHTVKLLVTLGIGGILFRSISVFLLKTEKGPLAGTGFLMLLVSFIMRYMNITHI